MREQGGATVADLARRLEVSESTIRRDLNHLDRQGRLQRVRGGGAAEAEECAICTARNAVLTVRTYRLTPVPALPRARLRVERYREYNNG